MTTITSYQEAKTKKAKVEFIRHKLSTDDKWVKRGLLAVYEKQTEDEQRNETVSHDNGVGFTGANAAFLSSLAKQLLKGRILSEKQMQCLRRSMPKYSGQLMRIAESD